MPNPISDAWFHRIKAAQRDLIARAGGIERASEITSVSKSNIGRWNNPKDPDLMSLPAVLALEADCGVALVTGVMADLNGRRLMEPEGEGGGAASVFTRHAETVRQAGELMAAGAAAFADGRLTTTELQLLDRVASNLEISLSEFRKAIGTGKGAGGEIIDFGSAK